MGEEDWPKEEANDAARKIVDEQSPAEETYELKDGDVISIATKVTGQTSILGGEEIANLELGGRDDRDGLLPSEKIMMISVHDKENYDYLTLKNMAEKAGGHATDLALLRLGPGGYSAGAFLTEGKQYALGSKGDIRWLPYGVAREVPIDWSPFGANPSIVEKQLAIFPKEGKVDLVGAASDSLTKVTSPSVIEYLTKQE